MNQSMSSSEQKVRHGDDALSLKGQDIRHGWTDQGRRVAVAMWDFSWLVRQQGAESEYADWGRVLDELVDRGYNCIRIDPFPHLLASRDHLEKQTEFTIQAQPSNYMWGNHAPVQVSPLAALRGFLAEIKKRPLGIALSSWFLDDASHRRNGIRTPYDYAEIWSQTLSVVAAAGALDRILWVDLCNEFPMSIWAPAAYQQIFRTSRSHSLTPSAMLLGCPWGRRAIGEMNKYFDQSISRLKRDYPELKYTFSFQEFGASNLRHLDLSSFDLIEAHIWLSDDLWWSTVSGHYKAAFGMFSRGAHHHAARASKIYPRYRKRCRNLLATRMSFWQELAAKKQLPLVTTEGWVSTFYNDTQLSHQEDEWAWYKDLTEYAVALAIDKGWSGICTSNFCQPHFPRFWADRRWHQRITNSITAGDKPQSGSES